MTFSRNRLISALALSIGFLLFIVALALVLRPQPPVASAVGGSFSLVSQDGKAVTEADLVGHPTLIFFGFTHCADVCPTTLFEISQVFAALGADKPVAGLFVSVDPERDTPALLKEYLASFDPRIQGLSGSEAAIARIKQAYRVYATKVPLAAGGYNMDHTAIIYLMDKQGRFVSAFNLERPVAEAAKELAGYL